MTYVLGIKDILTSPLTLFVETIHDDLQVSLGTDPLAALTFNNYEHALALSNLLDDANPSLPEFLPMEVSCQNED